MTLSKLITANNLEAIAAPEMNASARIRRNEAKFCTVDGAKSDGSEYASGMSTNERPGLSTTLTLSVFQPVTPFVEGVVEVGLSVCPLLWFGCKLVIDQLRDVSTSDQC